MRTRSLKSEPDDAPLTRGDAVFAVRLLLGLVVTVAAFLMVISAPAALFTWLHRDGYQRTDVVIESLSLKRAMVGVRATGETLSVGRTTFDMPEQLGVRRVWYNPDAKLGHAARRWCRSLCRSLLSVARTAELLDVHAHVDGNCQAKRVKLMRCSKETHVRRLRSKAAHPYLHT